MELNLDNLKHLHKCLMNLLKIFHRFCKENDLKYYLLGGSALGAIRHGGIIPWDDDIDIGMPRYDYDKFIRLFPDNGIGNAILKTNPKNRKDHVYPWAKIEDSSTRIVVKWQEHLHPTTGVFIDLFPLDGAPKDTGKRTSHVAKIQRLRNLLAYSYTSLEHTSILRRIILGTLHTNVARFIIEKYNNILLKKYPFDSSLYVGNPMGEYGLKEVMLRSIYGIPKEIVFEDIQSYVPEQTESYLEKLYGKNWSQMPPIEKRKSAHNWTVIDIP